MNNDSIVVPDFIFERIKFMEDIVETQFNNFVNDCLIFRKKPISTQINSILGFSCHQRRETFSVNK